MPKPARRNRDKYIENVVAEDYGRPMDDIVAIVVLVCGHAPASKERPFDSWHKWKHAAFEMLNDLVPEASRAMTVGYRAQLVSYIAVVYCGRRRIDNYYHEAVADQIKAARAQARLLAAQHAE